MTTPSSEPTPTTPITPVAPTTPTVVAPAVTVTSDKTSRYIAVAALAAAGLAGYAAYNANQQKPVAAVTAADISEKKTEPVATATASASAKSEAEQKEMTGEAAITPKPDNCDRWNRQENQESDMRRFHNSGNIADLAYDKEGNHTLRWMTGYELETSRYKGTGKCDEICFDTGTGDNKKATHFEDPNCEKPNTVFMNIADTYNPEADNCPKPRFNGLTGNLIEADPNKTVHVPGHVEPGKTCADLARKTNTGTGTVRISDGPTRNEFNNLNVRVGQVEKKVDEAGNTLAGLMDAYNDRETHNLCTGSQNPNCQEEVRSSIRKSLADEAKAQAEKK